MELFSLIGIYSTGDMSLFFKQIIWFFTGFVVIFIITLIGNDIIYDNVIILYIIGCILLLLLLFFGPVINNARCWFKIPSIGSIQISEFMKIILIIFISKYLSNQHNDFKLICLSILIIITPSILTFLEPDTGAILMYLIITLSILFVLNISYKWYVAGVSIVTLFVSIILYLYFYKMNLFIKILGDSFFLRIERLIDWFNKEGMQLNKGMMAISLGGLFGTGIKKNLVYFPEGHTDFIFATISSNLGFIGSFILIICLILFDLRILDLSTKCKNKRDSLILVSFVSVIFYQQFQNIGMTYGILPITGITLPFISYGGSSLLSYMIMIGMYMNIYIYNKKFHN